MPLHMFAALWHLTSMCWSPSLLSQNKDIDDGIETFCNSIHLSRILQSMYECIGVRAVRLCFVSFSNTVPCSMISALCHFFSPPKLATDNYRRLPYTNPFYKMAQSFIFPFLVCVSLFKVTWHTGIFSSFLPFSCWLLSIEYFHRLTRISLITQIICWLSLHKDLHS